MHENTISSDGFCDDGGPGAEYSMCNLGTDCTDCGSRLSTTPYPPLAPPYSPPPDVTAAHALAFAATGMMMSIFILFDDAHGGISLGEEFLIMCSPFVLVLPLALQLEMPQPVFFFEVVVCIAGAAFCAFFFFMSLSRPRLERVFRVTSAGFHVHHKDPPKYRTVFQSSPLGEEPRDLLKDVPNGRGMNLVAIDPRSGQVLFGASYDTYGDFYATSACAAKLESLKDGTIVLLAVKDEGSQIPERLQNAIRACGGSGRAVGFRASWAMVGKRGDNPGSAFEAYNSSGDCVTATGSFELFSVPQRQDGPKWTLLHSGWIPSFTAHIEKSIATRGQFTTTADKLVAPYQQVFLEGSRAGGGLRRVLTLDRRLTTPCPFKRGSQSLPAEFVVAQETYYSGDENTPRPFFVGRPQAWEMGSSSGWQELHQINGGRFIIRRDQIHLCNDYARVGGQVDNPRLGHCARVWVRDCADIPSEDDLPRVL